MRPRPGRRGCSRLGGAGLVEIGLLGHVSGVERLCLRVVDGEGVGCVGPVHCP